METEPADTTNVDIDIADPSFLAPSTSATDKKAESEEGASPLQQKHFNYIVIGGGISGVSCIEQIIQMDPDSTILLISASAVVKEVSNVQRITKLLNEFVVVERGLQSFHDVHRNVSVLQDSLQRLDPNQHSMTTVNGKTFTYDKLCLCIGASPKELNLATFDRRQCRFGDRILIIRDTDSVRSLVTKLATSRRILLIGNGGLATELAFELQNVDIVWSVKDDSISHHYLDRGAAEFLLGVTGIGREPKPNQDQDEIKLQMPRSEYQKRPRYTVEDQDDLVNEDTSPITIAHSKSRSKSANFRIEGSFGNALGPDWHTNFNLSGSGGRKTVNIQYCTELEELTDSAPTDATDNDDSTTNWPIYAKLTNGSWHGVDHVIVAIGVTPNRIEGIGLIEEGENKDQDPDKGIPVNERMETRLADVYAAGDCCTPVWTPSKHWFQMRLWTQARQMGLHAGRCMTTARLNPVQAQELDKDFCFEIFTHVTRFFGKRVVLLGLYNGQGLEQGSYEYYVRVSGQMEYIKLVVQEGRIQGALLIGDTEREETMENLIVNQFDMGFLGEDVLSPDVDIDEYFD